MTNFTDGILRSIVILATVFVAGGSLSSCSAFRGSRDTDVRFSFVDHSRKTTEELNAESEKIHRRAIEEAAAIDRESEGETDDEDEPSSAQMLTKE